MGRAFWSQIQGNVSRVGGGGGRGDCESQGGSTLPSPSSCPVWVAGHVLPLEDLPTEGRGGAEDTGE